MPDHVHMLFEPLKDYSLARITKGSKGVSAQLLNQHRGSAGPVWQDESHDHVIRDRADFEEKLHYVAMNPVKKELAVRPEDYPELFVLGL